MWVAWPLLVVMYLACVPWSEPAIADSLVIPDINLRPGNAPQDIPRPTRGMSMEQVREEFGEPRQVYGPVGDPPITRWEYDNFTVHFESQYVIHSVVNKKH